LSKGEIEKVKENKKILTTCLVDLCLLLFYVLIDIVFEYIKSNVMSLHHNISNSSDFFETSELF